jgi:hypothetical protein
VQKNRSPLYVSPKENNNTKKATAYQKQQFKYDAEQDQYSCPEGQAPDIQMVRWYEKNGGKHRRSYQIKRYISPFPVCSKCPAKDVCLTKKQQQNRHGRAIERSEYEDYVVANAERVKANKR